MASIKLDYTLAACPPSLSRSTCRCPRFCPPSKAMSITELSATNCSRSIKCWHTAAWKISSSKPIWNIGERGQVQVSAKAQQQRQLHSRRALRCNLARQLLHEGYRKFAARLADSPLLQFFCGISEVDRV